MTEQLKFFDLPPFQRHSATSKAAAAAIVPTLNQLQARVLAQLSRCGRHGATDEELQIALSLNPSTERPRRVELVEKGLVIDSGQTRKTQSGRAAVVWMKKAPVGGDPSGASESSSSLKGRSAVF